MSIVDDKTLLILTAITSLLSETEREFTLEMQAKQSIIDSIHNQLRESSAQLGEERRRLERLQIRAKQREERVQKIANLEKATVEENFRLSQSHHDQIAQDTEMRLGEADRTFQFPPNVETDSPIPDLLDTDSPPSSSTLRARINAFATNNETLESKVRVLKAKSRDLEKKYKRIICLCTRVHEDKVDDLLENLCRAVDSEHGDVELARVQDFLQKVEGVE